MRNEKNALFTIGQFAKLHSVNKKTLMWYAEIGLLKPACIKENGYRVNSGRAMRKSSNSFSDLLLLCAAGI